MRVRFDLLLGGKPAGHIVYATDREGTGAIVASEVSHELAGLIPWLTSNEGLVPAFGAILVSDCTLMLDLMYRALKQYREVQPGFDFTAPPAPPEPVLPPGTVA